MSETQSGAGLTVIPRISLTLNPGYTLYAKNEKDDLTDREKRKLVDAVKEITGPWRKR